MRYLKDTHTHTVRTHTNTRSYTHRHPHTQTQTQGSLEKGHEHRKSVTSDNVPKCLPVRVNGCAAVSPPAGEVRPKRAPFAQAKAQTVRARRILARRCQNDQT